VELELIQNADDSQYSENSTPYFFIKMKSDYIWTTNNELGFNNENVRALCLIDGSTKQSSEFIEEKGIGFKYVFRITNTLFVFSNDFQFKFAATKRLGYILPEWVNLTN